MTTDQSDAVARPYDAAPRARDGALADRADQLGNEPSGTAQRELGLAVGARLFAQHGYVGTTTRQIAGAMGLTAGTFYHYFDTKEDLLFQICDTALREGLERLRAALEESTGAIEAITTCVRVHAETITGSLDSQTTMLTELRSLTGDKRAQIAERRRTYGVEVEEVIRRGQAEGSIRSDVDAALLTLLFFNLMNWTIFWFQPEGKLSPSELADVIVTLLLEGIQQPPDQAAGSTSRELRP